MATCLRHNINTTLFITSKAGGKTQAPVHMAVLFCTTDRNYEYQQRLPVFEIALVRLSETSDYLLGQLNNPLAVIRRTSGNLQQYFIFDYHFIIMHASHRTPKRNGFHARKPPTIAMLPDVTKITRLRSFRHVSDLLDCRCPHTCALN